MNLNPLKILGMIALLSACGQSTYTESGLDAVELQGASQISLDDIKNTGLYTCLANPDSCKDTRNQGRHVVGLWASYEDDARGKARAICDPVCEPDQSFIGENHDNTTGTVMGMEVPKNWEIPNTAYYAYHALGRALGVIESPNAAVSDVSIQKIDSLKSSAAYRDRTTQGAYEIKVVTTNSATSHTLTSAYYFTGEGDLITIRNNQRQQYNERVKTQSAEVHVLE